MPAFRTLQAIHDGSSSGNITPWAKYWVVAGLFITFQYFAGFVVRWIPFYAFLRLGSCDMISQCHIPRFPRYPPDHTSPPSSLCASAVLTFWALSHANAAHAYDASSSVILKSAHSIDRAISQVSSASSAAGTKAFTALQQSLPKEVQPHLLRVSKSTTKFFRPEQAEANTTSASSPGH